MGHPLKRIKSIGSQEPRRTSHKPIRGTSDHWGHGCKASDCADGINVHSQSDTSAQTGAAIGCRALVIGIDRPAAMSLARVWSDLPKNRAQYLCAFCGQGWIGIIGGPTKRLDPRHLVLAHHSSEDLLDRHQRAALKVLLERQEK